MLNELIGTDLPSRGRHQHEWRPPVVSEHVQSILNPDTANVGIRSQKQVTQAGSSASSARSSRDLPSLGQPSWDPAGNLLENEGGLARRAGVSKLAPLELLVILRVNEVIRLGNLAAAHATALTVVAEHELRSGRVRREPSVRTRESSVGRSKNECFQLMLKKSRGQDAASLEPPWQCCASLYFWVPAGLLIACFSCGRELTPVHRCCPERRVR